MAVGKGTTTVDFGTGKTDVSVAVSAAAITTESVEAWVVPATTASNTQDNHWVEDLQVVAGPANSGVGFTIYAKCRTGLAHGIYNIGWVFA
jgi:hypothetical protein